MSVNERRDINNCQSNSNALCNICGRGFTTNRGLFLHLDACRRKQGQQYQQLEENYDQENTHRLQDMPHKPVSKPFYWNEKPGTTVINELNNVYEKIVYSRKNLFLLPTRAAEKSFINEMTQIINAWVYDTPIKNIALKALHIMPALLLQRPSKNPNSKDHLKSLEGRFEIWKEGNLNKLYEEGKSIQDRLKWLEKDYSSITFWNSNIRSPQSNCRTRQEIMYHKYIK